MSTSASPAHRAVTTPPPPRRGRRRATLLAGMSAVGLLALAAPASAHVTVHSADAAPGASDAVVAFRVPNERPNASTVKLQVFFPVATPLLGVDVAPKPGWTSSVATTTLAKPITTDDGAITQVVSEVTWTGGRVAPGQYDDFDVAVGQLPQARSLTFKVLQTYSSGEVVRWIDVPTSADSHPDHPAPVLQLAGAVGSRSSAPASGAPAAAPAAPAATPSSRSGSSSGTGLSVAALVVAVIALLAAAASLVRRRPV